MVIEIEITGDMEDKQEESYKKKRKNYAKANNTIMRMISNGTDWTNMKKLNKV